MKKRFVLIAAIVAVVGLGAAIAVAKETTEVGTSVSLTLESDLSGPKPDSFQGELKATKKGCEKGRRVIVYEHRDGFSLNVVGSDRSNDRGEYKVFSEGPYRQPFRAVVNERTMTTDTGNKVVCKEGRSKRVEFP
jgi:hypothetical protein